jgi:type IV secretory pathway VirB10-like protein
VIYPTVLSANRLEQEERVTKSILAVLTISMMATACGSRESTEVSAAAAPAAEAPAAPAAAPAPAVVPEETAASRPTRGDARPRTSTRRAEARSERADVTAAPRAASASSAGPAVPEYREFTLPAGTTLPLELKSAVASDLSEVEDTVRATLRQPVTIDGHRVLPAGTELTGTVIGAERAGRVKGRARVAIQFTSLRYDGERLPVQTEPIEQMAEATKGEDATKVGVGAGAGAVIGGLLGGKSGALKGAAIGGAAGTGAVMATRGKEVRIEPGTELPATLTAPLSVRVRLP